MLNLWLGEGDPWLCAGPEVCTGSAGPSSHQGSALPLSTGGEGAKSSVDLPHRGCTQTTTDSLHWLHSPHSAATTSLQIPQGEKFQVSEILFVLVHKFYTNYLSDFGCHLWWGWLPIFPILILAKSILNSNSKSTWSDGKALKVYQEEPIEKSATILYGILKAISWGIHFYQIRKHANKNNHIMLQLKWNEKSIYIIF